jgi:hypothetical protein
VLGALAGFASTMLGPPAFATSEPDASAGVVDDAAAVCLAAVDECLPVALALRCADAG